MEAKEMMKFKNWVVVGDVMNETKYAYKILNKLESKEYMVKGVHPKSTDAQVYNLLEQVPYDIDVIDLCINPKRGIDIVKEAKTLGIDKILIQPGAESEEILSYCKENGINAVEGCALVEAAKLG